MEMFVCQLPSHPPPLVNIVYHSSCDIICLCEESQTDATMTVTLN